MAAASKLPVPTDGRAPAEGQAAPLFTLESKKTDMGRADSLRYNILTWVLDEKYDRAIQELNDFQVRPSDYPNFREKTKRYARHSIDLIYAIKAKRNFPGINSLTRAKQQELREKFKEHFLELQWVLQKIEKVETDLRINDVRSTIYVVRALWIAALAIVLLAFAMEIARGLAHTTGIVALDAADSVTAWLFDKIGL